MNRVEDALMESKYFSRMEGEDSVLVHCRRDVRQLGLEYYRIVKTAVGSEPVAAHKEFGLDMADQAYMLASMADSQFADLARGGLPYSVTFNRDMHDAIACPEDRSTAFHQEIMEAAASATTFGSQTLSWKLRYLSWRLQHWQACQGLVRADPDLGRLVFSLPEGVELPRIAEMSAGELMGLALASRGRFRLLQTVPARLATTFSDANALQIGRASCRERV